MILDSFAGGGLNRITQLVAGDVLAFIVRRSQYPSAAWTMTFVLTKDGSKSFSKAADEDPNTIDHDVNLTPTDTATIKPGRLQGWLSFVNKTDATQRFTEYVGLLTVMPNPVGTLAPSESQQALTKIKATIRILVSQPESSASFNGQSYSFHNIDALYKIRDRLQIEVDNEMREMGVARRAGGARVIQTRFV